MIQMLKPRGLARQLHAVTNGLVALNPTLHGRSSIYYRNLVRESGDISVAVLLYVVLNKSGARNVSLSDGVIFQFPQPPRLGSL